MSSDGYFVKLAPAETCKHTIVLISEFLSFLGKTIHNNFLDHESAWEPKKLSSEVGPLSWGCQPEFKLFLYSIFQSYIHIFVPTLAINNWGLGMLQIFLQNLAYAW